MCRLLIVVPRSRRTCGRATLVANDGNALLPPMRILATASAAVAKKHQNPTRDRMVAFGHPPQGTYLFAGSLPPGFWPRPKRARRFGKSGAILLTGVSGEAREAAKKGRRVFYLHGGPSDRKGRLRPTRGGFRMLDRDLTTLLRAINEAHLRGDSLEAIEVVDVLLPGRAAPAERALTRRRRAALKRKKQLREEERRRAPDPMQKHGALSDAPAERRAEKTLLGAPPLALPAIALAAKLLGPRAPNAQGGVSRREVLALALLITSVSACCEEDRPSNCEPVACDPRESLCPPPERCVSSGGGWGGSYGDVTADDPGGG